MTAESSYRPALDGLRSIAVYLVVVFHSGLAFAGGGFIGVDVFFVLSGFLITTVLLSDFDGYGRIRFGHFYARRVRRLLPAAVIAIAATSLVFLLVTSIVQRLPLVRDAQSALLYVANWRFLQEQSDYFATGVDKSPFLHFWSLAIEEQFYVVFPLLLLLLARLGRRRPWIPTAGIASLFALSLAAQIYWASADPNHAYYGTDARAYQLLAGALLASALRSSRRRPSRAVADTAGLVGLGAVILLGTSLAGFGVSARGIVATSASTLLILGVTVARGGRADALLSRRTPVYLGRVSYATYLWHWPVILLLRDVVTLPSLVMALAAGAVATGLAAVSYRLLEMPIRRAPVLDGFRWTTVAAGVSACALFATAVVPPVLDSTRRPELVTASSSIEVAAPNTAPRPIHVRRSPGPRERVPSHLDWSALATDNGPARTCDAKAPQRCIIVAGTGLHVLLVGDSHARMLAPTLITLAHEHGFTLSMNVISSCPWQAQVTNLSQPPAAQAQCTASRGAWYRDVLPKLHPNVVILAEYARDDESIYGHTLVRTGGSHETLHQLLQDTTRATLATITAAGARALILKSIIASSFDPLDCLARSEYIDQCDVGVPRHAPVSDGYYAAAAAASAQVATFDLNRIICTGARICSPMIDGIPVWRNFNHYTTRILVHFRAQIWAALTKTGLLR